MNNEQYQELQYFETWLKDKGLKQSSIDNYLITAKAILNKQPISKNRTTMSVYGQMVQSGMEVLYRPIWRGSREKSKAVTNNRHNGCARKVVDFLKSNSGWYRLKQISEAINADPNTVTVSLKYYIDKGELDRKGKRLSYQYRHKIHAKNEIQPAIDIKMQEMKQAEKPTLSEIAQNKLVERMDTMSVDELLKIMKMED